MIKSLPARIFTLVLCLLLGMGYAVADGLQFTMTAQVEPEAYDAEFQPLMGGIASLLDILRMEGTLAVSGPSFSLDAALITENEDRTFRTQLNIFGLTSHWGVRSSLLGEQELMVNAAALLEFGQKVSNWLGIPLDKAALLVPYTHEYALQSTLETLSPLFPAEEGTYRFTRAELDGMAHELLALCEEDAALYRWLEVTGLHATVTQTIESFLDLPVLLVPGIYVTRTGNSLIWDVTFVNILTWEWDDCSAALRMHVPTKLSVEGGYAISDALMDTSLHVDMGADTSLDLSCLLPVSLSARSDALSLKIDADMPSLDEDGFHLALHGSIQDQVLVMAHPGLHGDHFTLTAQLSPWTPDKLASCSPESLTGMNILSVNGDSLKELMHAIRRPLLMGALDLIVAAPPEAVQAMMDYTEDSGLLDLMADALSGGTGY